MNESHPSLIARLANSLLDAGLLVITGGRVKAVENGVTIALDPNPIEHGQILDVRKEEGK